MAAPVFDRYRLQTYREAGYKPSVIAAMILLARFSEPPACWMPSPAAPRGARCKERAMSQIIHTIREDVVRRTAARCRRRNIRIPTFAEMRDPSLIPESVRKQLPAVGLWDVNPLNLFRITWKNDIRTGLFGGVNYMEIPPALTGVRARIIGLVGKFFPTGAHKVGAAFVAWCRGW